MVQALTEWIHEWKIKDRRAQILANYISTFIEPKSTILDVGCGDGKIGKMIQENVDSEHIEGIDVLVRSECSIPVTSFNGIHIPFKDDSFDYILLVDVLHHTEDALELLGECKRVSKKGIILKDHLNNSNLDYTILRFMDRVGNHRYDVHLPHLYNSTEQWNALFTKLNLSQNRLISTLNLYPKPFHLLFDRKLHALWLLTKPL